MLLVRIFFEFGLSRLLKNCLGFSLRFCGWTCRSISDLSDKCLFTMFEFSTSSRIPRCLLCWWLRQRLCSLFRTTVAGSCFSGRLCFCMPFGCSSIRCDADGCEESISKRQRHVVVACSLCSHSVLFVFVCRLCIDRLNTMRHLRVFFNYRFYLHSIR